MDRIRIVVMPAAERTSRGTLFDTLEQTLPVRFTGGGDDELAGAAGVFVLPAAAAQAAALPPALPRLVAVAEEPATTAEPDADAPLVALGREAPLDARLRGLLLSDPSLRSVAALGVHAGQVVLASSGRDALWLADGDRGTVAQYVAVAPAELGERECLRDRLCDGGRFLAVAALVHFMRALCVSTGWAPPPLRACFLFDDPNLHWGSYGHLRYRELIDHADRFGYHVAFATVPLDGWFASPATARLFRERAQRLSLVVHGNDHTRLELARPSGARERRALLAQALRRIESFERRYGVPVGRIMVAPHGVCSREMARDLVPFGFDALCISRPYPWVARPPLSWLARPDGASPLSGWEPASIVDDGLPVLLRRAFSEPAVDLALRAFLDQPLILYGHHGDMAGGLDRLGELANLVGRLGDVTWMSLADTAASNVTLHREGEALRVRMFTRRASVRVPDGVARVIVEMASLSAEPWAGLVVCRGEAHSQADGAPPAVLRDGEATLDGLDGRIEIRVVAGDAIDAATVARPARSTWKIARRLMVEGRDRLMPVYGRTVRQVARGRP